MASIETVGALVAAAILVVGSAFVVQRMMAPSFDMGKKMALLVYDVASLREACTAVPDNVYVLYYGTPDCKWEQGIYYCQGEEINITALRLDPAFVKTRPAPCTQSVNTLAYESMKVEYTVDEEKRSQSFPTSQHFTDFAEEKALERQSIPLYIQPRTDSVLISKQRRTFYDSLTSGLFFDKEGTTPVIIAEDVGMIRLLQDVMSVYAQMENSVFTNKTTSLSLTPGFRIEFSDTLENSYLPPCTGLTNPEKLLEIGTGTVKRCYCDDCTDNEYCKQVSSSYECVSCTYNPINPSEPGSEEGCPETYYCGQDGYCHDETLVICQQKQIVSPKGLFTWVEQEGESTAETSLKNANENLPLSNIAYSIGNVKTFYPESESVEGMTSRLIPVEYTSPETQTISEQPLVRYEHGFPESGWVNEICVNLKKDVTSKGFELMIDVPHVITAIYSWSDWCTTLDVSLDYEVCADSKGTLTHDDDGIILTSQENCVVTHYPSCDGSVNEEDDPRKGCVSKTFDDINTNNCCLETGECGPCIPKHDSCEQPNCFCQDFNQCKQCTHDSGDPKSLGDEAGCPISYCCGPDGYCTDNTDFCNWVGVGT